MPRRTLITAAIVTLLLGVLALAPAVPLVRNGLLGFVLRGLERQGFQVAYSSSAGNLWRDVTLSGVTAHGPGVDVEVDRLKLDYFLPSLLGGELPLDVGVDGARGVLDLAELTSSVAPSAPATSAPAGGGLRVRLGHVSLTGIELSASQAPFTLPNASVSDLSVVDEDGDLRLAGTITTSEGALRASGLLDLDTLDFTGVVHEADVRLARHWWPGAESGTVSGTFRVLGGQVLGDLQIDGGAVNDLGLKATDVRGTARLAFPIITAELAGQALGGPVKATGTVNVAAQNFAVNAAATPQLETAAAWLLRSTTPAGPPVPITGNADVTLEVAGWTSVEVKGSATGSGILAGLDLSALTTRFSVSQGGALRVDASADLAGGPVRVTVAPGARDVPALQIRSERIDLAGLDLGGLAEGVDPGGTLTGLTLDMSLGRTPTARLQTAWSGEVMGAGTTANVDARLDADGWQAFVDGSTEAFAAAGGAEFAGALVMANERIEGGVNVSNVALPGLTQPVTLSGRATGAPDALDLVLDLAADEPLQPDLAAAGVTLDTDLRGQARARLANGALGPVTGRFGPLSVELTLAPGAPTAAEAASGAGATPPAIGGSWTLADVAVAAPGGARGLVRVDRGRFELQGGAVRAEGEVTLAGASVGPITSPVTRAAVRFTLDDAPGAAWALRGSGEHVALSVGSGAPLSLTLADLPVGVSGTVGTALLSGAVRVPEAGGYELDAHVAAGGELAGFRLPAALSLAGTLTPDLDLLHAVGSFGSLPLDLTAQLTGAPEVALSAGELHATYSAVGGAWSATGTSDLTELLSLAGVTEGNVAGSVALDLRGQGAQANGTARIGLIEPADLTLSLEATGGSGTLALSGTAAGLPISGSGRLNLSDIGGTTLLLNAGPLTGIQVGTTGASGSGTLSPAEFGPLTLTPTPWSLEARWAGPTADVTVGGERLHIEPGEDGWLLSGAVAANVAYSGHDYRAELTPGAPGARRATLTAPDTVPLSFRLTRGPDPADAGMAVPAPVITASGTLSDLAFTVEVGAEELTALLPEAFRPDWHLAAVGTLDLLQAQPRYSADLLLTPGESEDDRTPISATVRGSGATAELTVEGQGLYLASEPGSAGDGDSATPRFRLTAEQVDLGRFLPPEVNGTLSGSLALEAGRWLGDLALSVSGPLDAELTVSGSGGETLALTATGSGPADTALDLSGTLLPSLELSGQASALSGDVRADLRYAPARGPENDGAAASGLLTAHLTTSRVALGAVGLELPALAFDLEFDPTQGSGRLSQVAGPGTTGGGSSGTITYADGALSGGVSAPVRTAAGEVLVNLGTSGPVSAPLLTATLSGAVTGDASATLADGVTAHLGLPAESVRSLLPEAGALLPDGSTPTIELTLAPSGAWQAHAAASLEPAGATLALHASGEGLAFRGELTAAVAGEPLATATLAGEGVDVRGSLDLAEVDWGRVSALLTDALGTDVTVAATGALSGSSAPLTADLTIDLAANVAGNSIALTGRAPDDLRLSLTGPAGHLEGELAWGAGVGSDAGTTGAQPAARLTGELGTTPVDLILAMEDGGAYRLDATYGGAELLARLVPPPEGTAGGSKLGVTLRAAPGDPLPFGADVEAELTLLGGDLVLDQLQATLTELLPSGDPVTLTAGGVLLDSAGSAGLAVAGQARTAQLAEPVLVQLDASAFTLTWRDLVVAGAPDLSRFTLTGSAEPEAVAELLSLSGAASAESGGAALPADLRARIDAADLTWTAAAGFSGSVQASATTNGLLPGRALVAELDARGNGALDADLRAWLTEGPPTNGTAGPTLTGTEPLGEPAVGVNLTLQPDPLRDPSLAGAARATIDLASLLPLPLPDGASPTAVLAAQLALGGTLLEPRLSGTASLTGEVIASGPVTIAPTTPQPVTVELTGPDAQLRFAARTNGSELAWEGSTDLRSVDLTQWLPSVAAPRATLSAQAGPNGIVVDELTLTSRNSRISGTGEFEFGSGARLGLAARVDLADLATGDSGLMGVLEGPVNLSVADLTDPLDASITASIAARGVGAAAVGPALGGTLTLGGRLGDPLLTADLKGEGQVQGSLRGSARPASGELSVTSDLSYGELSTDLRVSLLNGVARATGTARYGEAVLLISGGESDVTGSMTLTGAGRLSGWEATVRADLGAAALAGDLRSLDPNLAGVAELRLDASGTAPWLMAEVAGASAYGVNLGNIALSADGPLMPISVTGEHVEGLADLAAGSWELTVGALTLTDDLTAHASATGSFSAATLDARVQGEGVAVDVAASVSADSMTVSAAGDLYGGTLDLTVGRNGGPWSGTLALEGTEFGGVRLDAQGTILGGSATPQLVVSTDATLTSGSGMRLRGLAAFSAAGVTLDQVLTGADSTPLRVQGRAFPELDLTLATLVAAPSADGPVNVPTISQARLRTVPGVGLRLAGSVRADVGPVHVALTGQDALPRLSVNPIGLPQLRVAAALDAPSLAGLIERVSSSGLRFEGSDAAHGSATVRLTPAPRVQLDGFGADLAGVSVTASGTLALDSADLSGEVTLATDLPLGDGNGAPGTMTSYTFPWRLTTADAVWQLSYAGEFGSVAGTYAPRVAPDALTLDADLAFSGGTIVASLDHLAGQLSGSLEMHDLQALPPGLGRVTLNATGSIADGRVGGTATADADSGRLTVSGNWALADLLPPAMADAVAGASSATAQPGGRVDLRLRNLELGRVPLLQELVPYLSGTVTGAVQLRNEVLFGQFVSPEITAGGASSHAELALSGTLRSIDASLLLKGATLTANLADSRLSGSGRFERFPAQFLAQAVVGPSDVTADVTGVLRFDLPLQDLRSGYLRLATEEVRLERAGVPTIGNVTLTLDDRSVLVENTEFTGLGRWEAAGHLREDDLDFHLEAVEADFTPLLGLFPSLARAGVGAEGSLTLDIKGDLARPEATFASPGLDIELAGSRYRLEDTEVALTGSDLTVSARVEGVAPLSGSLDVSGGAHLDLAPFAVTGLEIGIGGSLALPGMGVVEGIAGSVTQDSAADIAVDVTGRLGEGTAHLTGTLLPLDLSANGQGLTFAFPALLIATAVVDADLRLVSEPDGVALGGAITASEVIVDPNARANAQAAAGAAGAAATPAATEGSGGGLAGLRFSGLAIRAPQRVLLTTNIGLGEAALDLVLSGTGAQPRLTGTVNTLRGNIRFSGRDFTIDRAVATFSSSSGLFPALDVTAHTQLDKSRVTAADGRVSFAAPREGQSFVVNLAFAGQMQEAPASEGGFRFDVQPRVWSDARIEVDGEGPGSGVRSFTEAELMSLLTLGRFELNAGLVGSGGLGAAVAQGALDTAVDLLVVSELANAIRQSLGLDVVEIRTSALSSLFESSEQPFGVSLRLGGYLSQDLFASYRIGTYDGRDRNYSVTNEVLFSYALGPLDLDLTGRIDFPAAGMPDSPRSQLGASLSYSFGPMLGVDAGVLLSTDRSAFQVGLTLRW